MPNGRKKNVVEDELKQRGAGVYCVLPYDKVDKEGRSIFKVGMTGKSFLERLDKYHTYYPLGVYLTHFLLNPPVPKDTTKAKHYLVIERFVMDEMKLGGAEQIHSTARVKHLNVEKKGQTEFFYAKFDIITKAFVKAQKKFGGELTADHVDEVNENYKTTIKKKPNFVAEIIYPIEKK